MAPRSFIVIVTALCLAVIGCGQKQKPATQTAADIQAAVPEKTDTADVFNEFYSETKEPEKKIDPTFSLNEPESFIPAFTPGGAYITQVASMVSRHLADELATELREKGYPAYVSEVENPRPDLQGTYYRVRIGRFASISDARTFGENVLKPANYDFWVDRKSNDQAAPESRSMQTGHTPAPESEPVPVQQKAVTAPQSQETNTIPSNDWGSSGWQDNSGTW
ncbi:MAG: SPOR domain-containing protein [Chitinispirillaceae bacterium]|nr:SPOR domain-containing protein [Chitinispirillaceae bacterium]